MCPVTWTFFTVKHQTLQVANNKLEHQKVRSALELLEKQWRET